MERIVRKITKSRWTYALFIGLMAMAALFGMPSIDKHGNIGITAETADAARCWIDREGVGSVVRMGDRVNKQTGEEKGCQFPSDFDGNGCIIIDAANLDMTRRLAEALGLFDPSAPDELKATVQDLGGGKIRLNGPVYIIIAVPFSASELFVQEGQIVIPGAGKFWLRAWQRINVAINQAERDFVPDGKGGWRPRKLDDRVFVWINYDLCAEKCN